MSSDPLHQYVRDIEFTLSTALQEIKDFEQQVIARAQAYKDAQKKSELLPPFLNAAYSALGQHQYNTVPSESPSIFNLGPAVGRAVPPKLVQFEDAEVIVQTSHGSSSFSFSPYNSRLNTTQSSTSTFCTPPANQDNHNWVQNAQEIARDPEHQQNAAIYFRNKMNPVITPHKSGFRGNLEVIFEGNN